MHKYLVIVRQSISYSLTYRLQIFLQILQSFITPILLISALFAATPNPGVALTGLIPYYLFVSLIYPLVVSNIDEEIENLAVSGDINNFLTKPLPLFHYLLFKNLGEKISIAVPVIPAIILILIIRPGYSFGMALISLPVAFLTSFCLSYFTGLFCFWLDEFWAISNLKAVLISLLGGIAVPLAFFPAGVARFIKFTPFPYLASFTVRILQNSTESGEYFIALAWLLILYLLCIFMEKISVKKYSFTAS